MKVLWSGLAILLASGTAWADTCPRGGGSWGVADPVVSDTCSGGAGGNTSPPSNPPPPSQPEPPPPPPGPPVTPSAGTKCDANGANCHYVSFEACVKGVMSAGGYNQHDAEQICRISNPE